MFLRLTLITGGTINWTVSANDSYTPVIVADYIAQRYSVNYTDVLIYFDYPLESPGVWQALDNSKSFSQQGITWAVYPNPQLRFTIWGF